MTKKLVTPPSSLTSNYRSIDTEKIIYIGDLFVAEYTLLLCTFVSLFAIPPLPCEGPLCMPNPAVTRDLANPTISSYC